MIVPEMKRGSSEEMQWVEQEGCLAHRVAKGGLWIFALQGVDNGCGKNFGIRLKVRQTL
jgi:hypothetical protein